MKKVDIKTIDASGRTLGRVASETAGFLMGKNKPSFKRNVYSGSKVLVINASKLSITPRKLEQIYHTRYSGIPGGLHIISGTETRDKMGLKELIKLAAYRMLPGNKLRREMMKNLRVED
ncbi:50S ribosomal protein L13 [Candidatus Nomurabacteria bacterium RIFCSPLOWO2_01_FULL_39_17]|uniref:50S ribosomal protein L13 n=1 Tax=Candidatus Nomurabacteria bacterium RIFCSPLOWO2_01_FULL_39_17 TaxID=1801770 RepID=A0A1F6WVR7_9BACT|nr:MAG: 50S ribosomal protein L13 [Candidatus Nomurabacteria bacterium RIFCSPLOWO2_01_FULL_39_17]